MQRPQLAFNFCTNGMNGALDPALLGDQVVARLVNCRLDKQLPRSRWGYAQRRISEAPEGWSALNLQGAIWYDPAYGLSGRSYSSTPGMILESAGGRKFAVRLFGRGANTFATVEDVTTVEPGPSDLHLAWLCQAEPYAVCCDGVSDTWIWDADAAAFLSPGYNTIDKGASRLANGASIPFYANYRIHQVVNGRQVIVGDPLHRVNQSNPSNLLETTEQAHLATGLYFSPPANMGAIVAAGVVPIRDNRWGANEIWYHCRKGIFSVNTSPPDRASWAQQALVSNREYKGGASGPYALDVYDHAAVFLSPRGIEMLFAGAGASVNLISPEVQTFLETDHVPDRLFASLVNFNDERLYCTVFPQVRGPWRSSRGAVVLNWNPTESKARTDAAIRAWEGLHVLPPDLGEFVQFVPVDLNGEERLFVWAWRPDPDVSKIGGLFQGERQLLEVSDRLDGYDQLSDGTRLPVESKLITKVLAGGEYFANKDWDGAQLFLRDVIGDLQIGVYFRPDGQGPWLTWDEGTVASAALGPDALTQSKRNLVVKLGRPRCDTSAFRHLQLLVRWKGAATIEGILAASGKAETLEFNANLKALSQTVPTPARAMGYSDYERYFQA